MVWYMPRRPSRRQRVVLPDEIIREVFTHSHPVERQAMRFTRYRQALPSAEREEHIVAMLQYVLGQNSRAMVWVTCAPFGPYNRGHGPEPQQEERAEMQFLPSPNGLFYVKYRKYGWPWWPTNPVTLRTAVDLLARRTCTPAVASIYRIRFFRGNDGWKWETVGAPEHQRRF